MNTILSILISLVLYAVVIYIVGRLNLGMTVDGFVGAFIAGWLFPTIGLAFGGGIVASIIHATLGAVILLFLIRLVKSA